MKPAVQRVLDALNQQGVTVTIHEFAASTRTAADAAAAVNAAVGQIVKSLVFRAAEAPILVLVSGANRVDESYLGEQLGQTITRASAETVRGATGFAIGGVPPLGHATVLPVYCDRDLLAYPVVWAAAGTPNTVFAITPDELCRIAGAQVIAIRPPA